MTVSNTAPPAGGPAASYAFDDGAGTTASDASGHGLTGTLANGPTWGAGKYGARSASTASNDYVDLGNPTALRLTGSMTISAWINSAAFPVDDAAVVSKRGSVGFQLDTTIDRGPRTIGFKLTNSSGADMIRYGATTLQLNTWYHIAGVYDAAAATMDVYLNGRARRRRARRHGHVVAAELDRERATSASEPAAGTTSTAGSTTSASTTAR